MEGWTSLYRVGQTKVAWTRGCDWTCMSSDSDSDIFSIMNPFVVALTDKDKAYSYFQQNGATAFTSHKTMDRI
ncbi:hypothetical protein TNCV_4524581 [Trichonephila clavipes]|nr:hypothetical protein TNCV_4524581 [Trichonephila clavipes]